MIELARHEGVMHRFNEEFLLLVPGAGTTMQVRQEFRLGLEQAASEHLGKQVMIAIPPPLLVQRDHKEIRPFKGLEPRLASRVFGHSLAERGAEALEDRGAQQKRLDRCRLPGENLFGEIIQREAVAAGKGSEERRKISSALKG